MALEYGVVKGQFVGKMFSEVLGDNIGYYYKIYSIKDRRKIIARSFVSFFSKSLCFERMNSDLELLNLSYED